MAAQLDLRSVRVENLRGFRNAHLEVLPRTLLVGPNNAGKTSISKLLDFVFNGSPAALRGERDLTADEYALVRPARETRNRARRITLRITVRDGRRWTRFECDHDGVARMRITLRRQRIRLNIGRPRRGEPHSGQAWSLLEELRESHQFLLIPAARDANADTFGDAFHSALLAWLAPSLTVAAQTGAPREYRQLLNAQQIVRRLSRELSERFISGVGIRERSILAQDIQPSVELSLEATAEWIVEQARVKLVTGKHDERGVFPEEVGSGLQSLLMISLHRQQELPNQRLILAIEEPESHLHPALQRSVARELLDVIEPPHTVIASTHSSQVVSEAKYGQTVIVKDHRFYAPLATTDDRRASINSVLAEDRAAEAFFAESILLVEGPGDRSFFESIRKRLAALVPGPFADRLFVIDVGGSTRFGPWLQLLRSYGEEGDRPFNWLAVVDGDATGELATGLVRGGFAIPQVVRDSLSTLGSVSWSETGKRDKAATEASRLMEVGALRGAILPVDIEWELLRDAGDVVQQRVAGLIGTKVEDGLNARQLARKLGSKVGTGSSKGEKDPWIRTEIGSIVTWGDLSPSIRLILRRWLSALEPETDPRDLLRQL